MAITADFHLHSSFSGDSDTRMDDMIRQGLRRGLHTMCFTEHRDLAFPVTPAMPAGMFEVDTAAYRSALHDYQDIYRGRMELLFGVELGMQPIAAAENSVYAKENDFDFIIASSHLCNGKDPYSPSFYEGKTQEEAYREYFASILENLELYEDFDVYGHLDYVVRYGPNKDRDYSYEKYQDLFDPILCRIISRGKGIEVNTGGLSSGLKDLHPCRGVLRRYKQLGGEIVTVGSDAHTPERIGFGFDRAADALADCGFRYYTVFRNRRPEFLPLDR